MTSLIMVLIRYQKEKLEWQDRLLAEQKRNANSSQNADLVKNLTRALKEAEAKLLQKETKKSSGVDSSRKENSQHSKLR